MCGFGKKIACFTYALFAYAGLTGGLPTFTIQAAAATEGTEQGEASQIDPRALYEQALQAEWSGNYPQARALLERAAELGHARALYQLGFLKMDGLGGPRDVNAARRHFRASADAGHRLALVPLIYTYDDFEDVEAAPDPVIASHALLDLSQRDLGMAGDTIQFWSGPLKRQIQRDLRQAGYYAGPIDGLIGQGSLNGLRRFARSGAPLPSVDAPRFSTIRFTAEGVSVDGGTSVPFDEITSLREAREATLGVTLMNSGEGRWEISHEDRVLLHWNPSNDAHRFVLLGKPRSQPFGLGDPKRSFDQVRLALCSSLAASRSSRAQAGNLPSVDGSQGTGAAMDGTPGLDRPNELRCETTMPEITLVFAPAEVGQDDLAADESVVAQKPGVDALTAGPDDSANALIAIEILRPLRLRLGGNQVGTVSP